MPALTNGSTINGRERGCPRDPLSALCYALSTKSRGGKWVEVGDDMWGPRIDVSKLRLR
jgi:hypothetical protein